MTEINLIYPKICALASFKVQIIEHLFFIKPYFNMSNFKRYGALTIHVSEQLYDHQKLQVMKFGTQDYRII